MAESSRQDDPRGDASKSDVVAAVHLVLAAEGLTGDPRRLLQMVRWIVDREKDIPERTVPVRLFIAAIEETKR